MRRTLGRKRTLEFCKSDVATMFPGRQQTKRLTFKTSSDLRFSMDIKEKELQPGTLTTEGRGWLAMRDTLGLLPGTRVQLTGHPDDAEISIEVIGRPSGRGDGGGGGSGGAAQQAAADAPDALVAARNNGQQLRPEAMVNCRVAVHWDGNDTHFPGTIVGYNAVNVSCRMEMNGMCAILIPVNTCTALRF